MRPVLAIKKSTSVLLAVSLFLAAQPAFASGGSGGNGNGSVDTSGGSGASGYTGTSGGNAYSGGFSLNGSGGGGGGAGGGTGGAGSKEIFVSNTASGGAGGAGGSALSKNGSAGNNGSGTDAGGGPGGGGGGGGYNGNGNGDTVITNSSSLSAGNGGNGGNAASGILYGGGGGGGGAGGYGAIITGSGASSNSSSIAGGNGGNGGNGSPGLFGNSFFGSGGNGGDGGIAILFTTSGASFTNSGTVSGGAGGTGGGSGNGGTAGSSGAGGVGISGSGLSITNSGTISGGLGGDGTTRADAIDFTGGTNTLTLQNGSTITGDISNAGSGSLTISNTGTQTLSNVIKGNGSITKSGAGTLVLSGSNTYSGTTSVTGGILRFSADSNLGSNSSVTLNGGTLQTGGAFTSAKSISIGTSGGTIDTQSNTNTFSGNFTGNGSLTKTGSGTLVLTGSGNTYSGGTTINGGTLQLGSAAGALPSNTDLTITSGTLDLAGHDRSIGSLSGSSSAHVAANGGGTLFFVGNNNSSTTYNGVLENGTGSLDLNKVGTGTLTLNGISTYDFTVINAGNLQVGDDTHSSARINSTVTVSGGILSGHGTIGGNVTASSGSTVSPGGSIGTLTVSGNYTQNAGSSLAIQASPSANSVLSVTGAATLGGTVAVTFDAGAYSARSYTFLNAGSISGAFSGISGSTPGFAISGINYTSTTASFSLTPLANSNPSTNGSLTTALTYTNQLSNNQILSRIDTVNSFGAGTFPITENEYGVETQVAADPSVMSDVSGLFNSIERNISRYGGWFRGFGNFGQQDGSSSLPGFTSSTGGFLAGLDRKITRDWVLGIAGGYDYTDVNAKNGGTANAAANIGRLFAYATTKLDDVYLSGNIGYAYGVVDTQRYDSSTAATAKGNFDQQNISTSLQVSQNIDLADNLTLTPKLGAVYTHTRTNGYTESGAGAGNLTVSGRDDDSLRPSVGATLMQSLTDDDAVVWKPEASLRFDQEVIHQNRVAEVTVNGANSNVTGNAPVYSNLNFGVGLAVTVDKSMDMFVRYNTDLPIARYSSHNVSAGLKWSF